MSICEISIENFKSIVSGRAKFTEGINFIYGPNGAGKSSILDALAYALYGSEWLRRSRLRLADLVRVRSRTAVIRVKVRGVDGKTYIVQRVFTPEKTVEANTYVLDESGKRVASRDKEVTSFVEKILNVSVSVFSELLYVRQGELRSILDSSKRTETKLDKVLKIESLEKLRSDYLKEVRKLAEMHLRRIEGKISIIDEELSKLSKNIQRYREEIEKLEKLLEDLERKRVDLEDRKCKIERELENVKQDVDKIRELEILLKEKERELERLENRRRELEEFSRDLEVLRRRLEELNSFVDEETRLRSRLDRLRELKARLEVELKEIESREKTRERFRSIIERRKQELERLERELNNIEQLEKDIAQLEEKLRKIEKAKRLLDKFREEFASLQALKSKLEEEIKLLKDSKGVCPLCGRELSEHDRDRLIEEKIQELDRLRERLSLVESKIRKYEKYVSREEELKERYYRLREAISRKEEIIQKIESLRKEVESLEEELSRIDESLSDRKVIEKKLEKIIREISDIEKKLSNIEEKLRERDNVLKRLSACEQSLRDLESIEKNIEEVKSDIEKLKEELSSLSNLKEKYESLKREYENIIEELKTLNDRISEIRGRLTTLREQVEKMEKDLQEKKTMKEKLREEYSKYYEAHKFISKVMDVVDRVKPVIRRIFLELLNNELNSMFVEVCHKTAFVSIRVTEDYEIYVKRRDGVELSVDALSVGERNLIALLFRYALAKVVLGNVPFLILDEPTEHLDDEHRKRIAQWLKNVSSEVGMIIITSHVDAFETVADNIIRVEFINEEGESTFRNT